MEIDCTWRGEKIACYIKCITRLYAKRCIVITDSDVGGSEVGSCNA